MVTFAKKSKYAKFLRMPTYLPGLIETKKVAAFFQMLPTFNLLCFGWFAAEQPTDSCFRNIYNRLVDERMVKT